ncbi:hypothetical protein CgunFtcFv8_005928 [Champsocephalus gunnari]|uniref:RNA methyltransferase n=1 Tax=Champsocephalus gunnari TaxID=52237 RepID=A0AAN8GVL0_CHAGU|nr:hypothetical protein CgunFtcFv8_005928 [Champsocephalus gunnari]
MIRMSLDTETVLPHEVSPAAVSLSEQSQLAKSRALHAKNGLQLPGNSHPAPAGAQRIAKRRYSMGVGFKGLAKRRRRANSDSQSESVLPSNFLLGGNIFDPLNLNSLLDEDVNRATNQETPKCSPLPLRGGDPVEILVPRDITDPLNLKGGGRGGGPDTMGGGEGRGGGVPARLFSSSAALTVPLLTRGGGVSASPLPCELNTAITCRDDVAPPPILPRRHTHPLPGNLGDGRQRRRRHTTSIRSSDCAATATTATRAQPTRFETPLVGGAKAGRCGGAQSGSTHPPQKKKKDKHRYQHGNHSRYYGYQGFYGDGCEGHVGPQDDPRLRLLRSDWFRDRTVLDIGCGTGHMALAVARRFNPAHILGVELKERLVHAANQNIRHFMFPHNVTFVQGDYVSLQEAWPGRGQYDVIMCLNVTKWVQMHSGDGGVATLFRRAYQSLAPGGLFILQPQPWSSYCRSKRASERTCDAFRTLRFRPEQFTWYLTEREGFSSYRTLTHTGDERPIYLFNKGPAHRK